MEKYICSGKDGWGKLLLWKNLDTLHEVPSLISDVTDLEISLFLSEIIQMGHGIQDKLPGNNITVLHTFLQ
jgi:hypothetical protein